MSSLLVAPWLRQAMVRVWKSEGWLARRPEVRETERCLRCLGRAASFLRQNPK
jgi:hypothetical protein